MIIEATGISFTTVKTGLLLTFAGVFFLAALTFSANTASSAIIKYFFIVFVN